jgi:hypothetical protein
MSRWFGYSKTTVDIFLPLAAILFVVTMWRVFRQPVASEATAFAMTLALALLIYPGALISYSTLLIVPIVLLVRRGLLLPVAATYVVTNLGGRHFIYTGIACALLWLVLIALRPKDPAESAQSSLTKRFGLIPDSAPAALS